MWFLRNVALMAESPDELCARARQEWERAVVWEAVAKHAPPRCRSPPLPATAAEQVAREAADAVDEVRRFYERGGCLSQPPDLRRYLNAELPAYLAPLRFLGVCDDLTDELPPRRDGVSYVPPPGPRAAATSTPPTPATRAPGSSTRARTTSSSPSATATPTRSGGATTTPAPNEGIAFYNEEYLLQAGLFDDAPHTRAVIWNFARLRALRVEADVQPGDRAR